MTKRILALLLAVLFAASCCLMTACGDENKDNKPADKTSQKTSGDKQPDDGKKPTTSDKPGTSGDKQTSDVPGDSDTGEVSSPDDETSASAELPGEYLGFSFYTAAIWEAWHGGGDGAPYFWQTVLCLDGNEADFKEGIRTEDYKWTWEMNIRPAESPANTEWWTVTCQMDTVSGMGENTVIYRLQPGIGYEGKFTIDDEYEAVVVVKDADGNAFKSHTMYFYWKQEFQDQYEQWLTGHAADNETCISFVPELAPHGDLIPGDRTQIK